MTATEDIHAAMARQTASYTPPPTRSSAPRSFAIELFILFYFC
jgi:hypothetical protein